MTSKDYPGWIWSLALCDDGQVCLYLSSLSPVVFLFQGPYPFPSLPNTSSYSPLWGGDGSGPWTGDTLQRPLYFKNESNLSKFCSDQNDEECNFKPLGWCLEVRGSTHVRVGGCASCTGMSLLSSTDVKQVWVQQHVPTISKLGRQGEKS